jgi:hypothetical protein
MTAAQVAGATTPRAEIYPVGEEGGSDDDTEGGDDDSENDADRGDDEGE